MEHKTKIVLGVVKKCLNSLILLICFSDQVFAANDNDASGAGVGFMLILIVVLFAVFNGLRGKDKEDDSYDPYDD